MNQAFSKIWVIVIIIALLIGGILVWQYFGVQKEKVKAPEKKIEEVGPKEVAKDETANWKTYRNEEYGFEIRYPDTWRGHINAFAGEPNMIFCSPNFFQEKNDGWLSWTENPNIPGCASKRRIWSQDTNTILIEGIGEISTTEYSQKWKDKVEKPISSIYLFVQRDKGYENEGRKYLGSNSFGYWYLVKEGDDPENNVVFNQMLSTFKFVEKEETECDKWRKECATEGEYPCGPCGCTNCCPGLVERYVTHPYRSKNNEVVCLEDITTKICVKCGDGICGKGEDWCICPEDCSKPDPINLELRNP